MTQLQPEGLAQAEKPFYLELAFISADGQGIPSSFMELYICMSVCCVCVLFCLEIKR